MIGSSQNLLTLFSRERPNNLNAIRLVLAVVVILTHSFPVTTGWQREPLLLATHGQMTLGSLAVDLFFFISGFLIAGSWLSSKSMSDYLRRRILRIVPGYFVALVFSFLVATAFAAEPFANLHTRLARFQEVFWLDFTSVCGTWVFPHNAYPGDANGSLWTIQREFVCYLVVAGVGLFGLFRNRRWILSATGCVMLWYCLSVFGGRDVVPLDRRFLAFFLAGVCVWLWRDKIFLSPIAAALALVLSVVATQLPPVFLAFTPFAFCYATLCLGFAAQPAFAAWCDRTDLSYGTYLFAFPIQQALAALGLKDPWILFLISTPATLVIAMMSWRFIEKPALRLKSRDFADHDPALLVKEKQRAPEGAMAQNAW